MELKIGLLGKIQTPASLMPYVLVDDTGKGGYLIITSSSPYTGQGLGTDQWVLYEDLKRTIADKGWEIEWTNEPGFRNPPISTGYRLVEVAATINVIDSVVQLCLEADLLAFIAEAFVLSMHGPVEMKFQDGAISCSPSMSEPSIRIEPPAQIFLEANRETYGKISGDLRTLAWAKGGAYSSSEAVTLRKFFKHWIGSFEDVTFVRK